MSNSLDYCISTNDKQQLYFYSLSGLVQCTSKSCSPNLLGGVPIWYYLWLHFPPFGNNEGMVVPILAHKDTFDHRQSSYPMCPSFPLENQINQSLTLSFSLAFPPSLPLFLFHSCSYAILKYVLINLQESYLEFEGRQ